MTSSADSNILAEVNYYLLDVMEVVEDNTGKVHRLVQGHGRLSWPHFVDFVLETSGSPEM